jgi:hypothetical protein
MSRILLIIHHIALCIPCIAISLVSHTCAFCVDPAEQEPEELQEPEAEETNPKQE